MEKSKNKLRINFQPNYLASGNTAILMYVNFGQREITKSALQVANKLKYDFSSKADVDAVVKADKLIADIKSGKVKQNEPTPKGKYIEKTKYDDALHGLFYSYKPLKLSTGIVIPSPFWDNKKKQATGTYKKVNKQLRLLEESVIKLFDACMLKGDALDPDVFKDQIKKHILEAEVISIPAFNLGRNGAVITKPTNFVAYINYKLTKWKKRPGTFKNYRKFREWIITYEATTKRVFDLKTMTDDDVIDFIDWVSIQTKPDGSPYKLNYINFFRTIFKALVTEAINEDDMIVKVNPAKKYFNKDVEEVDDIYLNMTQIQKMKDVKFQSSSTQGILEHLRKTGELKPKTSDLLFQQCLDAFVVKINCGLRWSDYSKLKAENFIYDAETKEWKFMVSKTEKTADRADIPCMDEDVVIIFKKYNNAFPNEMAEQTFNETIKIIALLAGLTEVKTVETLHPVSKKTLKHVKRICDMVTSKTCRKTFASNLIRHYKLPLIYARALTTHKTESSFKHYINFTDKEYYDLVVESMNEHKANKIKAKLKVV